MNARFGFRFATDSETGTIEASCWNDACQQLHAMVTDQAIDNGAWGWVEDEDGERYEIGVD